MAVHFWDPSAAARALPRSRPRSWALRRKKSRTCPLSRRASRQEASCGRKSTTCSAPWRTSAPRAAAHIPTAERRCRTRIRCWTTPRSIPSSDGSRRGPRTISEAAKPAPGGPPREDRPVPESIAARGGAAPELGGAGGRPVGLVLLQAIERRRQGKGRSRATVDHAGERGSGRLRGAEALRGRLACRGARADVGGRVAQVIPVSRGAAGFELAIARIVGAREYAHLVGRRRQPLNDLRGPRVLVVAFVVDLLPRGEGQAGRLPLRDRRIRPVAARVELLHDGSLAVGQV